MSGQSYNQIVKSIDDASSTDEQLAVLDKVLESEQMQLYPDTLAMLYYQKSSSLFRGGVSISESIEALDKGLEYINSVEHRDLWIKLWYYKGYWYRKWDKYEEAKQALSEVLSFETDNSYLWDATIQLGKTFKDRGEFSLAFEYYDKAIVLAGDDKDQLSTCYEVISFVYLIMGTEEAAAKSIPWLDKLIALLETMEGQEHFTASMIYNKGTAYLTMQEYANAAQYFDRAEEVIDQWGGEAKDLKSLLYESRGSMLAEEGKYDEAIIYYKKGLELYQHSFDLTRSDGLSSSYTLIADTYHAMGKQVDALSYITKALSYRLSGIDSGTEETLISTYSLESNGEKHYLIDELILKAQILIKLAEEQAEDSYLAEANTTLEYADIVVDYMRLEHLEESTKEFWRSKTSEVYGLLVKVNYKLENVQKAFLYAEKSKYLLMGEHLVRQSGGERLVQIPIELRSTILEVRAEVAMAQESLTHAKSSSKDSDIIDSLRFAIIDYRKKEDDVLSTIKRDYPQYYSDNFSFDIATVDDVRKYIIKNNQTLIEYYLDDTDLYVFVIQDELLELRVVPVPFDLTEKLVQLRSAVTHEARNTPEQLTQYASAAFDLYKVTIDGVKDIITDDLIIVADNVLALIPFSILIMESIEDRITQLRIGDWPYLFEKHNLSYIKSASLAIYQQESQVKRHFDERILAFNPSYESISTNTYEYDKDSEDVRGSLGVLKGAIEEIAFIKEKMSGAYFEQKEATETNFKKALTKSYSIFHLASHAIVDDVSPEYSKLVLNEGQEEDGYLHAYEIANLPLQSDLVILSACNTGFGQIQKGEGVNSLGKSFARAGSPNLLMSLWPVSDKATSTLIKEYYNQLVSGVSKRTAITEAKHNFLASVPAAYHHPYYWGGFIYYGDDLPLQVSANLSLYTYVGGGLALLFLLGFLWWKFVFNGS